MSYKLLGRTDDGRKIQVDPASLGSVWIKLSDIVPSSTTKVIETLGLSTFHGMDYIITMYNEVEAKTKKLHLTVIREGATIKTSVHGRLGSMTGVSVNGNVNATDFELEIINNNIYQIDVSYARLTL